jgi:hypothetical protein
VQGNGLTWRDGAATLFMAALVAIYVAFLRGTGIWLISSARGTTAAVLVFGMFGGRVLSATRDLYTGPHPQGGHVYRAVATLYGVIAFAAGLVGLVTGSTVALAALVGVTLALWVLATMRHAFTSPGAHGPGAEGPVHTRENHEVIHQGDATRP